MSQRPIEQHLADFYRAMGGEQLLAYRKRLWKHWKQVYGEATCKRVEGILKGQKRE